MALLAIFTNLVKHLGWAASSPEMVQAREETWGPYIIYTPQNPLGGERMDGGGLGIMSFGQWRGWNGGAAGLWLSFMV